jgi:hypothetical protein
LHVSQTNPVGGTQEYDPPPDADNCVGESEIIVILVPALAVGEPVAAIIPLTVFVQLRESVMITEYVPAPILLILEIVAPPLFHK